jgi:cytochrome c-type biogenesis protein
MKDVGFAVAFSAGVLSFLSPCVLPLLPSYVSFITGLSFESLTTASAEERARTKRLILANSIVFIAGFSSVFISLGASSSMLGVWLDEYRDVIRVAGGVLVIIFGLFISGLLRLKFLMRERKVRLSARPLGYAGAFLVGMSFAAGWTPCIGPILGSILLYTASKGSALYGFKLLSMYSLGLAVPFLVSAMAINSFLLYSRWLKKYMPAVMFVSGMLLVAFGIVLLTNNMRVLSSLIPDLGIHI